jgi:hypothetical protein
VVPPRRKVQFGQVFLGLFLAALGAGVVLVTLRDRLESAILPVDTGGVAPPSAADARADSILLVTRGAAQYAREHAVAARVPPSGLAAGDSLRTVAESLAARGEKTDAALLLQRATILYTAAETSVPPEAGAAPAPSPAAQKPAGAALSQPGNAAGAAASRPAAPQPSGPGEAVPPDSVAIGQFYADLGRAVASRQLSEVQRLLPNMNENEMRDWRDLFTDEDIRSIDATYRVLDMSRRGEVVYARVKEDVQVQWVTGKSQHKRDNVFYTQLTYGPQGWREIRRGKAPK